jgi:hypothetical protein
MIDQPMHLRLKKGMLIGAKIDQKLVTALVVSDVYSITDMHFKMIDIVAQGRKRKFRTTWVKEIYSEAG